MTADRPRPVALAVVGAGAAGLYAAVVAAQLGHDVVLLAKDTLADSNTWHAQGGICAVGPAGRRAGDSVAAHLADTRAAGAGANHAAAAEAMCAAAWGHIERLAALGVAFDRDGGGAPRLALEAAHSHARILHAGGDATGRAIAGGLASAARALADAGRLRILEHTAVRALAVREGRVRGVRLDDGTTLGADAVLLATGGIGRLYPATTNPAGATGDGPALAWEAGAVLADAEFVQFHPTLVADGPFMVSEAVRGEGALLLDGAGHRFMPGIHPAAELAPRDVVARAIHRARAATGAVHLDATGVEAARGRGFLAARFPTITARLAELGHDLAAAPVPVTEAQHYWMGGIHTDLWGRTTVPGLLAAGECAATGAHGANRLASNSLLEALAFAGAAVAGLAQGPDPAPPAAAPAGPGGPLRAVVGLQDPAGGVPAGLADLHATTGTALAVEREAGALEVAAKHFDSWHAAPRPGRGAAELRNLLVVGRVVAAAALHRRDSLGAHHRIDHPQPPAEPAARFGFSRTGSPA